MQVNILSARADNYMYLLDCGPGEALVVDPCDEAVVSAALSREGLRLTAILATHHHNDHVAGIPGLKQQTGCTVYGPESQRIDGVDRVVRDGEELVCGQQRIRVLATPGHTRTSVCYAVNSTGTEPLLFSGDTLFVGGCGRLFEGDGPTLWNSLQKLRDLPEDTRIYCGHEYTLENLAFGASVSPGDARVQQRVADMRRRVQTGGVSVPSTLGWETGTNIFLRAGEDAVKRALGLEQAEAAEVFTELRRRKDRF
jgi:hydroxyacylglutathione hydrolase